MSESYIKAEIVRPKLSATEAFTQLFGSLFNLAIRTLILWWFFAAWFPELGLTYWQLVLPVFAVRTLISRAPIGRQLK
jgi:hypothetical protein